jgi:hypothetical protein
MPLDTGCKVGSYEVVSPLGAGGMGEVYRARDTRLGRDVALKVLAADCSGDPDRLRRFEQEARILAGLNHPNIHLGRQAAGAVARVRRLGADRGREGDGREQEGGAPPSDRLNLQAGAWKLNGWRAPQEAGLVRAPALA